MANIYVARLDYGVTQKELRSLFEEYGRVVRCTVVTDKDTGNSKGFAFIEMENDAEAKEAISKLDGYSLNNREMVVKEAEERSGERKPFEPRTNGTRPERPAGGGFRPNTGDAGSSSDPKKPTRTFSDAPKPDASVKKFEPKARPGGDGKKTTKMNAYKKSGKEGRFLDDDDDSDIDYRPGREYNSDEDEDDDE